jgi:hypothetical protein
MKQNGKFGVTQHALVRRINRALAHKQQELWYFKSNREKGFEDGAYIIIDNRKRGTPVDGTPLKLEKLARELGVMEEWEFLSK